MGLGEPALPFRTRRATGRSARKREEISCDPVRGLLIACLDQLPAAKIDTEVRTSTRLLLADPDAENRYWNATVLAICGKKDIAVRLIKSAIEGHYCAYTALKNDPLMATLRDTPEFSQLLSAAKECENNFLSERAQVSH